MDRRSKLRLDVELICYVSSAKMFARTMKAVIQNVSRTGMLMRWANSYPTPTLGKKIMVEIDLPENSLFGARSMQCRATVLRVEKHSEEEHSVALRIDGMKFTEHETTHAAIQSADNLEFIPMPTDRAM